MKWRSGGCFWWRIESYYCCCCISSVRTICCRVGSKSLLTLASMITVFDMFDYNKLFGSIRGLIWLYVVGFGNYSQLISCKSCLIPHWIMVSSGVCIRRGAPLRRVFLKWNTFRVFMELVAVKVICQGRIEASWWNVAGGWRARETGTVVAVKVLWLCIWW